MTKALLLTERPEDQEDAPGDLVRKVLREIGYGYTDETLVYEAVLRTGGDKASMQALREYRGILRTSIGIHSPDYIICLGESPLKSLTDDSYARVERSRRKIFKYEGLPYVVTYSPQDVLKKPISYMWWGEDLESYLVRGLWQRRPFGVRYEVVA